MELLLKEKKVVGWDVDNNNQHSCHGQASKLISPGSNIPKFKTSALTGKYIRYIQKVTPEDVQKEYIWALRCIAAVANELKVL